MGCCAKTGCLAMRRFSQRELTRVIARGAQSADDSSRTILLPTILLRTIVVGREPCKRLLMRAVKSSVQLTTVRVPRGCLEPGSNRRAAGSLRGNRSPGRSLRSAGLRARPLGANLQLQTLWAMPMSRVVARRGKSRKPTDRRHKSECLAAKPGHVVFAIPHSIRNQRSLINNSPQAPLPCLGHVRAGALTCSAERSSAIVKSTTRRSAC
jgi:hypothetical protein